MNELGIGVFLAVLVKALLDYVAAPVRAKWPEVDLWWFDYVALAVGAVVAWLAPLNLLGDYVANELLGRVLTALLVGGGAKLLNDVFASAPAGRDLDGRGVRLQGW